MTHYRAIEVGVEQAGSLRLVAKSWHGSLAQFLAGLDPGSTHDWVRAVLDEPSGRTR